MRSMIHYCVIISLEVMIAVRARAPAINDTIGDSTLELEGDTQIDLYDEQETNWIREAVVTVGYYLRKHKFHEWDRRYFKERPSDRDLNLYESFPTPPLRYFHWDVFGQCQSKFETCLRYLYETVVDASVQRSYDTVYVMRKRNLTLQDNRTVVDNVQHECERLHKEDSEHPEPFKGFLDRFQWSVTASYYMCMFTLQVSLLQGRSELKHFGEPCDNLANCLQEDGKSVTNHDLRANDSVPFNCARYSFCPDPCCKGSKVVKNWDECRAGLASDSPCRNSTCTLNETSNQSLTHMVYNYWNVSCDCSDSNFVWSSRFGICIDVNECEHPKNACDKRTQYCVNLKGTNRCRCKFGFKLSKSKNGCVENKVVTNALKRFGG